MEKELFSRRSLMERIAAAVGLLASASVPALAASDTAHVSPEDPVAVALGYTEDATKVDASKSPSYAAGEKCANCMQNSGAAGAAWGPCMIFGGKLVNESGWCRAYVKKN